MIEVVYKDIINQLFFCDMDTKDRKDVELLTAVSNLGLTPKEAIQVLMEYQDTDISSLLKPEIQKSEPEICKDKPEIFEWLKELFGNWGYETVELTSKLYRDPKSESDLFLDSLDLWDLLMRIEEEYSRKIPDNTAKKWKTVEDVVNAVYEVTHPAH